MCFEIIEVNQLEWLDNSYKHFMCMKKFGDWKLNWASVKGW
jgi:hypothetical protein